MIPLTQFDNLAAESVKKWDAYTIFLRTNQELLQKRGASIKLPVQAEGTVFMDKICPLLCGYQNTFIGQGAHKWVRPAAFVS